MVLKYLIVCYDLQIEMTAFKLGLFTPLINTRMCAVVELPRLNPFWLGQSCLSIDGLIMFRNNMSIAADSIP